MSLEDFIRSARLRDDAVLAAGGSLECRACGEGRYTDAAPCGRCGTTRRSAEGRDVRDVFTMGEPVRELGCGGTLI